MRKKIYLLHLQQFADGAAGDSGVTSQDAAGSTGEATQSQDAAETQETRASFDDLVKGEYKEDFDKAVQKIVRQRFAKAKANEEKLSKIAPILQTFASRYGIDADDLDSMARYVSADDALIEEVAYQNNMTPEQYRENNALKAQLNVLRAEKEENERIRAANEWVRQNEPVVAQLKAEFPDFDLATMMQNEQFTRMVNPNNPYAVGIREAYLALNMDHILPEAMNYTAQQVAKKTATTISQRGSRPVEGGISGRASAKVGTDVSKLSNAEIAEYVRRAQRGEHITL